MITFIGNDHYILISNALVKIMSDVPLPKGTGVSYFVLSMNLRRPMVSPVHLFFGVLCSTIYYYFSLFFCT